MNEKKTITASQIGTYAFCPRAWVLQQLDYEPDNQRALEKGKAFHEETGALALIKNEESRVSRIRNQKLSHALTVVLIITFLCLISILTHLLLK